MDRTDMAMAGTIVVIVAIICGAVLAYELSRLRQQSYVECVRAGIAPAVCKENAP